MIRKSLSRNLIRNAKRFPACAKFVHGPIAWTDAAAGRSDKITRKPKSYTRIGIST